MVLGVWIGTIGTALVAGKMAQAMFGYDDQTGIYIWMFLATGFTIYGISK